MNFLFQTNFEFLDFYQEINKLKKDSNSVILSHYFQDSEIQDISDHVADCYELSKIAKTVKADNIFFCGTKYMAEFIKIYAPEKRVFWVCENNEEYATESEDLSYTNNLKKFLNSHKNPHKNDHKEEVIISYINSPTQMKIFSDVIITSSNFEKILNNFDDNQEIIIISDGNFSEYIKKKIQKNILFFQDVKCDFHNNFSERELILLKTQHPNARIISHVDVNHNLFEYAEFVGGSNDLCDYVKKFNQDEFIVLSESGIIHHMQKISPNSKFYDVPSLDLNNNLNSSVNNKIRISDLEIIYNSMITKDNEIIIEEEIFEKIRKAIMKMEKLENI